MFDKRKRDRARSTVRIADCCANCTYRKTHFRWFRFCNWCRMAGQERDLYQVCGEYIRGTGSDEVA